MKIGKLDIQGNMILISLLLLASIVNAFHQILPEKVTDFRIVLCSHERQPMQMETMLYFPETVKFCSSLKTDKNVITLARDRQMTTFLQPLISVSIHELGSSANCRINYMGYGGEYRLSPDLGYYTHCQRSISQYINQLVDQEPSPEWNTTNANCPIQGLPANYKDYIACDLVPQKWYELQFESAIKYEVFHHHNYRQFSSNFSTTFLFKPDLYVNRNGSEIDWLLRLIDIKAKLKKCEKVRYLVTVDEHFNLPVSIEVEYRITDEGFVKYARHVGNGTIDHWYSGHFVFLPSPIRDHQLCVKVTWPGAKQSFWICRTFARRGQCNFNSSPSTFTFMTTMILSILTKLFIIIYY